MLPITLITGFLGSGKTTLLQRIAREQADRKRVFLVNEFNPRDIDGALLVDGRSDVVSLPGGSIFCRCLVSEFISQLRFIRQKFPHAEGLVIEASGIADPRVMRKMLSETRLDADYRLERVVCTVDPSSILKLRHTLPNVLAQIEAADLVIVNKIDLATEADLTETLALIHRLNPSAVVRRAKFCEAGDIFSESAGHASSEGEYAPCRDPNYATFTTPGSQDTVDALRRILTSAEKGILRVKGFIAATNGSRLYLDYSGGEIQTGPAPASADPEVVWIVLGSQAERIQSQLAKLGVPVSVEAE